jgi:hypothetical protein
MLNDDDDDEYFNPFEKELREYLDAYNEYLTHEEKLKSPTVSKHISLLSHMIGFACGYHSVYGFEDFTLTIIGSKMLHSFNHHNTESYPLDRSYRIIYRFFDFIYSRYGIANHELLAKLRKRI